MALGDPLNITARNGPSPPDTCSSNLLDRQARSQT